MLYDPVGKRRMLHVDKPFTDGEGQECVPEWLEALPVETPAQVKARKTSDAKAKKASKKKVEEDKKAVEGASFMDGGSRATDGAVESL
jgi:hypothetical protein